MTVLAQRTLRPLSVMRKQNKELIFVDKKRLVIVGGGYAGAELAKAMDPYVDVTLIEPRAAFVMSSAAIRAMVDPSLLDRIIMPYDSLLTRGRVIRGRARTVGENNVTLADGDVIPADMVVVATGSTYATPFKPVSEDIVEFRRTAEATAAKLAASRSVVIVGAGAVGTELAGEIAAMRDDIKVTLISADSNLFPDYPRKFGARLHRKLEKLGVELVMGQRVKQLQHKDEPHAGSVTLTDGTVIDADLVVPAVGSVPQMSVLRELPGSVLSAKGRAKVDPWLRPSPSYQNVFALGDIADTGDGMTIVAITRQVPWMAKMLRQVVDGRTVEQTKRYKPWQRGPLLLPLGSQIGASWIFATFGNWVTRKMKGESLFIPKYRKIFGLKDT
ncbi:NAD(P)/FAD-dependent oxidoreductase [Phaeobacter gallaeciensis]|uniref:NAD(P)/FAD-dependent oxidoreductase n=1 Tax=Phaeobacter gallaeciensis TaxID=60890 RepID=UPI001FCCECE3|nr:FAD-dependent oxidoreductase [Phaeobacter gallaeciensis]